MSAMKNWKMGNRIMLGFAAVIALSIALGVFAYSRTLIIEHNATIIERDNIPSVIALGHVQVELYHIVGLLLQRAASSDQHEMAGLEAQIRQLREINAKSYQTYEALPWTPEEAALYDKVKLDKAEFWSTVEDVRKLSRVGTDATNAQARTIIEKRLKPILEKFVADLQAILDFNNNASKDGLALVVQSGNSANWGILIGMALSIAVSIPIVMVIVRGIAGPLALAVETLERVAGGDLTVSLEVHTKDEVGRMATALNTALENLRSTLREVAENAASSNTSSRELAAAAEQIATGAQLQAASLEETSASLEQITATVRQSADNAEQASQLATGSREAAEQGQEVVSSAIAAMAEINTASEKISDIISTINEIAFQTNLLAVNAAVEAARAGEEGRGFAVVATEVRSLAQRSAEAAKEIKGLIQDSLAKVEKGSELVNRSGTTLQGIVGSVKRVTDIVGEIAAALSEQSVGVDQVNTAISQMDQVTQSNSAQTEELSSTAQNLSGQAGRVLELVNTFTLDNGRSPKNGGAHQPLPRNMRPSSAAGLRPVTPATRAGAGKSAPAGRKQPAPSVVLAGSSATGSSDANFEEF
jgi:methyl-accepting chemotaxis protein